jgi:hypothetical protein
MIRPTLALALLVLAATAHPAGAQDAAPLSVGDSAPDFELPGATQAGLLDRPVRLSELRDQTVVIAFFYRAKTRG